MDSRIRKEDGSWFLGRRIMVPVRGEQLENGLGEEIPLDMARVPCGSVWCTPGQPGPYDQAGPAQPYELCLERSFLMGIFPVTRALWAALMDGPPRWHATWYGDSFSNQRRDDWLIGDAQSFAVDWVDWDEAHEFTCRISRETGLRFSLPTEVEWESACRAGNGSDFPMGHPDLVPDAYFRRGLTGYLEPDWSGYRGPLPENHLGFCGMQGFLQEWCADEVTKGGSEINHVLRGSSRNSGSSCWGARERALAKNSRPSKAGGPGFRVKLDE